MKFAKNLLFLYLMLFFPNAVLALAVGFDIFLKKDNQGKILQQIVVIGDRHTYYSEYDEHEHERLTVLKDNEKAVVLKLAKRLNATVLAEDPFSSWWHVPRQIVSLVFFKFTDSDNASCLKKIINLCKKNNIKAVNIEERNPAFTSMAMLAFNAFLFEIGMESTNRLALSKNVTFINHIKKYSKQWLSFLGFTAVTVATPLLKLLHNKNKILARIDKLACRESFLEYIKTIKADYLTNKIGWETDRFGWLLDTQALLNILEQPFTNFIVCAGYHHTQNISRFLIDQGFEHAMQERMQSLSYTLFPIHLNDALDLHKIADIWCKLNF